MNIDKISTDAWKIKDPIVWVEKYLETLDQTAVIGEKNNTEYSAYKRQVITLTNRVDISGLENSNNRGRDLYHLDHIFPTSRGFALEIPAELIADINNLTMLSAHDNQTKSNTIIEVPEHILVWLKENNNENYQRVLNEIDEN